MLFPTCEVGWWGKSKNAEKSNWIVFWPKERVYLMSSALLRSNASEYISNALHVRPLWCVGGRKLKSVPWLLALALQLSGQVITLPFGVFTPPSPNALWSHWVSITTNPFHSFKINGCEPSLTPEISQAKPFFFFRAP